METRLNPNPRKRILFIVQELTAGGAAYLCIKWIKRLVSLYEIDLLIIGPYETKMLAALPAGVSVVHAGQSAFSASCDRLGSISALGALRLFMRRNKIAPLAAEYQAILATSILASWQTCIAFALCRSQNKILFLVDEALATCAQARALRRNAVALSLLVTDRVVSVSSALFKNMSEHCTALKDKPCEVMWPITEMQNSPPDAQQHSILPHDKPIVLTVARLAPGKQILESLQIHHALRQQGIDFRWYIVGAGEEEGTIRAEIKRLGMEDFFILEGFQQHVANWMRQCDVFALLSVSEGCPTVIIEALQLNCVVISTEVNGVDELLVNEKTGIIVANQPDKIAQQLSRLVSDSTLRERIKNNLIQHPLKIDAGHDLQRLVKMIEAPKQSASVPACSILIPAYNQQDYLDKAISSALMQDFNALEVAVIDDASTDNTELVCAKWLADPRFRYIKNSTNLGRVKNYHYALNEVARGDWVLMLDGDDYLTDAGYIKAAWETAQNHIGEGVVFVQAGHRVEYASGNSKDVDMLPDIASSEMLVRPGNYLKFVFDTGFFTHLGILFNRAAAIRHGCYQADISSSDMDSFLRLSLQGPVILLNRIAGCWVQHGNNASASVPMHHITENVKLFRAITDLAIKQGLTSKTNINPSLSRYEAQTLAYLFAKALSSKKHHPLDTLQLIPMIIAINPKLLFNFTLLKTAAKSFIKLCLLMFKKAEPK